MFKRWSIQAQHWPLRRKMIAGYGVAMLFGLLGSGLGLILADYYQGQGIEQLSDANRQARLLTRLSGEVERVRLAGVSLESYLGQPERLLVLRSRIRNDVAASQETAAQLMEFLDSDPSWLADNPQKLALFATEYVNALDFYAQTLDAMFPKGRHRLTPDERRDIAQALQTLRTKPELQRLEGVSWQLEQAIRVAQDQAIAAENALEAAQGLEKTVVISSILFAVLLSMLGIFRLTSLALRPLESLTTTAKTIAIDHDYSLRAPIQTHDEIGILAKSFNRLIAQIEQQTQQLTTAKDTAEAANRAKSTFIATMSHELRTPLNAISGFTQLLTSELTTPQHRDYLDTIQRSSDHLLSLINDILDISRLEAGKLDVAEEVVNLPNLWSTLEGMFRLRAESQGLMFAVRVAATVPTTIRSDGKRLRQILINVIGNAIKFTKSGSVMLTVDYETAIAPQLHLTITDTGVGIAPEEIPLLFKPFSQTQSGRDLQQGTGLGLMLCQQFVELLNGAIAITSQLHHGTTVSITLPAIAPEYDDTEPLAAAIAPPSPTPDPDPLDLDAIRTLPTDWLHAARTTATSADFQALEHLLDMALNRYALSDQQRTIIGLMQQWLIDYRFDLITELLQPLDTPPEASPRNDTTSL